MNKKVISGLILITFAGFSLYKFINYKNRRVCKNVLELIGKTPLLYIESLSKLTKCKIYVRKNN
jgi:hypothetical protein